MCGIAGLSLLPGKRDAKTQSLIKASLRLLILGIQNRGPEATGVCWASESGDFNILKANVKASDFLKSKSFPKWEESIPGEGIVTILAHTRYPTLGSVKFPRNNHPILCGPVIGVHNGHITNHEAVKTKFSLKSDGEVDSEVIFRVLEKDLDATSNTFDMANVTKDFAELYGQAAIAAVNVYHPEQLLLVKAGNPIGVAENKSIGMYAFSSFRSDLETLNKSVILGWETFDMLENKWIVVTSGPKFAEENGKCKLGRPTYSRTYGYWDQQLNRWIRLSDPHYDKSKDHSYNNAYLGEE